MSGPGTRPRNTLGSIAFSWIPVAVYCAIIFHFSSKTGGQLPHFWLLRHDKVCHSIEYSGLGFLLYRALRRSGLDARTAALVAIPAALLFGVSDEFHQSFVPDRQGNDPGDMLADLCGGSLGVVLGFFAGKLGLFGRLPEPPRTTSPVSHLSPAPPAPSEK